MNFHLPDDAQKFDPSEARLKFDAHLEHWQFAREPDVNSTAGSAEWRRLGLRSGVPATRLHSVNGQPLVVRKTKSTVVILSAR